VRVPGGAKKVAGRKRWYEEATHTAPDRPHPTDPGDAADLSIPQGFQLDGGGRSPPRAAEPNVAAEARCEEASRYGAEINRPTR